MYNEVKRFYLFRRRRWADTLFDTLYHVIFILGFYSLLRGNSDFQLSYFYYYFILTHVVSLGNEELEYEIRSGQSFGIQYALQSLYRIYLQRAMVYFVWLSLIFWIALLLIHQGLPTHFSLEVINFQGLLGIDWFLDFSRLLSSHDSTDHSLPTDFSLGRFSKYRAFILLRTRLSSGEFWEFEEII